MARTVGIGHQDYKELIESNAFYVDKTHFIKEWWENLDIVTLITRPRRFGKTLTMSMRNTRNLSCTLLKFCESKGNFLFKCQKENLPNYRKSIQPL